MKKTDSQLSFPLFLEVPGIGNDAGDLLSSELSSELETLRAEWQLHGLPEPTSDDEAFVAALGYCPSCSEPLMMPCPEQCLLRHRHVEHVRKGGVKR